MISGSVEAKTNFSDNIDHYFMEAYYILMQTRLDTSEMKRDN